MEIKLLAPISDAPLFHLLCIRLFCKPKMYREEGQAVQYYSIFGRKFWTRKFVIPKDSSSQALQILKNRQYEQRKNTGCALATGQVKPKKKAK